MKKNEARKKGTALVKSNGNGVEKSYAAWIAGLKRRYRATQIKAAVAVNSARSSRKRPDTVLAFLRRLASTCGQNSRMTLDFRRETSDIVRIFTACIPSRRFCHKLWQNLPRVSKRHQKCYKLRQNVSVRKLWTIRFCNRLLHNWFLFRGDIIAPLSINAKASATRRFSMCGGRSRTGGVAIRF